MKTDQLRHELQDVAAELEPFLAEPSRVRGRVRARRAGVAAALVIAIALPAALALGRDDGDSVQAGAPKAVAIDELAERDALVVVAPGSDVDATRAALDQSRATVAFAELSSSAATVLTPVDEWNRSPACATAGFVIDITNGSDLPALPAGTTAWSWDEVVANPQDGRWSDANAEVFLTVGASAEESAAVKSALSADPRVAEVVHLTKQDAYDEFVRIFRDQPELVASTTAEALPESYRFRVASETDAEAVAEVVGALPGVDEVLTPAWVGSRSTYVDTVLSGIAYLEADGELLLPKC